jgi:hypothetical protein
MFPSVIVALLAIAQAPNADAPPAPATASTAIDRVLVLDLEAGDGVSKDTLRTLTGSRPGVGAPTISGKPGFILHRAPRPVDHVSPVVRWSRRISSRRLSLSWPNVAWWVVPPLLGVKYRDGRNDRASRK